MNPSLDLRPFADFAHRIADTCRPILRRHYRRRIDISIKPDSSPVTAVDRETEKTARELIGAAFPAHGIYGEEFGTERADAEYVWIIDPLDGTKAFITGRPLFGTIIALLHRQVPVLGLVDMPILGDRWIGLAGHPTLLNGDKVQTRPCANLNEAYISTNSPYIFNNAERASFLETLRTQALSTTFGGDCYQYGMIASGFLDLVVECGLGEYDYLGLAPIVEGAGGIITDWQGKSLRMGSGDCVIAAGDPRLHKQALSLLR